MFEEICKTFAPSGNELELVKNIEKRLGNLFDEIRCDNIGNLICTKGSGGICIECGMDSCGIMIVSVAEGKAHFAGVGGINAEYLIGKKILFADGSFGIVRYDGKTPADSKISDLYLETDSKSIRIGSFGVVKSGYCESDAKIFANGLGNKTGLAAVLKCLENVKCIENLTVLFSAQKRLGAKGIRAFLGDNAFEKVIIAEGIACDSAIKSGDGCALVVADKAGVCKDELRKTLEKIAEDNQIKAKTIVTDEDLCMGYVVATGEGAECALVGIPVENKNKNFEVVKKADFIEAVKFLTLIISNLQK